MALSRKRVTYYLNGPNLFCYIKVYLPQENQTLPEMVFWKSYQMEKKRLKNSGSGCQLFGCPLEHRRWSPSRLNFINVLHKAFYACRSQMCKNDSQVVNLFTLLGSTSVKAAYKTLMKLRPGILHLCPKIHR